MRILNKEKLKTYFFYLTVFTTGGAILVIEILGTRILAPFYGSTIFVWSSLITITMAALALGYFVGGFLADKKPEFQIFYALIFLAGVFTGMVMKFDQPMLVLSDKFGPRLGPLVAALVLFSIPLFLLGTVSPFAIRLRSRVIEGIGRTSGSIFALATLGSLSGALLSGFFLVPRLSLSLIFVGLAALLIAVALLGVFLFSEKSKTGRKFFLTLVVVVLLGVGLLYFPRLSYNKDSAEFKLIHQEQSFYADLKVVEGKGVRCLLMDGAPQTCLVKGQDVSPAEYIQELERVSQQWPEQSRVLLLGLGAGAVVKGLPNDFALDIVELDPQIVKLAEEYFDFALDENDRLFVDDARSFLRKNNTPYDIIISDVYFGKAIPAYLCTREFFELLSRNLAKGGVVISNVIGRWQAADKLLTSIVSTQAEVFPKVVVAIDKSQQGLGNILVYAAPAYHYYPSFWKYQEQNIVFRKDLVVTDERNPLELLLVENVKEFSDNIKATLGYLPFFSL